MILSTVRSSDCPEYEFSVDQLWLYKKLGFLTDDHQINVAITRAKFGLVIIGKYCESSLSRDGALVNQCSSVLQNL